MSAVPQDQVDQVRENLQRVRNLSAHGLSADELHSDDLREWYRSLLRVFGDIREVAEEAERQLSQDADSLKILTPSEISEAARISRGAVYKRRAVRGK
ncbi:hypothetical protein ACFY9H_33725 [Streptomyces bacillaris]|uniref:hypothetical protein n=1 Tax=Streptomyces bacillaris TaxID=68179 RepID=UPI0036E86492